MAPIYEMLYQKHQKYQKYQTTTLRSPFPASERLRGRRTKSTTFTR